MNTEETVQDELFPDDDAAETLAEAGAHWSLFVPAVLVAALYGASWIALDAAGRGGGALSRLIFLVLVAAPPLLLGHAFLRFYSTGVVVTRDHILVARGWPHQTVERVPLSEVEALSVRASLLARLLGSGSLHIRLWDGRDIDARDLARPQNIVEALTGRLHVVRPY
jgi:uncharacterized membrane protein YdbT with pleckstrin-like domain